MLYAIFISQSENSSKSDSFQHQSHVLITFILVLNNVHLYIDYPIPDNQCMKIWDMLYVHIIIYSCHWLFLRHSPSTFTWRILQNASIWHNFYLFAYTHFPCGFFFNFIEYHFSSVLLAIWPVYLHFNIFIKYLHLLFTNTVPIYSHSSIGF